LDEDLTRLPNSIRSRPNLWSCAFFGGLSIEESAGVLRVSRTTLSATELAKAWLARELRKGTNSELGPGKRAVYVGPGARPRGANVDFCAKPAAPTILCRAK